MSLFFTLCRLSICSLMIDLTLQHFNIHAISFCYMACDYENLRLCKSSPSVPNSANSLLPRNLIKAHCKKMHGAHGTAMYRMSSKVAHVCLVCGRDVDNETKRFVISCMCSFYHLMLRLTPFICRLNDHMHKSHKFNLATYEERYYFPTVDRTAGPLQCPHW